MLLRLLLRSSNPLFLFQNKQHLTTDIEEDLDQIATDREAVARILTNLIDNALKYSPPDSHIQIKTLMFGIETRIASTRQMPLPEETGRIACLL